MEYIITEQQNDYLDKWKNFRIFMLRRNEVIIELISKYVIRPKTNPYDILDNVVVEFTNMNNIDNEDKLFDWVYHYVKDNYSKLIEEMYEDKEGI